MAKQHFYSNGKLLLTGEYLVLDGANALALPTKMGQSLQVLPQEEPSVSWKSFDADGSLWLEEELAINAIIDYQATSETTVRGTLLNILHHAALLRPNTFDAAKGFQVETRLTFPREWGLGTSSTLINNVAQWFNVDAFQLLKASFGGSGYDIACAQNDTPIFYRLENNLPVVTPITFQPKFADHLYFVYLNQKQSSKEAIAAYFHSKKNDLAARIEKVNALTATAANAVDLKTFALVMQEHEKYMSSLLELPTVKDALFSDFNGVVKSLGAWGGDFVLVISENNPKEYFAERGFYTFVSYFEMIL